MTSYKGIWALAVFNVFGIFMMAIFGYFNSNLLVKGVSVAVCIGTAIIVYGLIYCKNWARLTMLAFYVVALAAVFIDFISGKASQAEHLEDILINIVSVGINLIVIFYLNSRSVLNEFKRS